MFVIKPSTDHNLTEYRSKKIFAVGWDCFVVYAAIFVGQIFVVLCSPSTNYILHPFSNRFNNWRDTTMLLERYNFISLLWLCMHTMTKSTVDSYTLTWSVRGLGASWLCATSSFWYQHHFLMNMIVLLNDRHHSTTKVIKSTSQVTTGPTICLGRLVRLVSTSCSLAGGILLWWISLRIRSHSCIQLTTHVAPWPQLRITITIAFSVYR
jgi:hypothetical protein